MKMLRALRSLWDKYPLLPIMLPFAAIILTWLGTEINNFTSDYRAMLDREVSEVQSSVQEVHEVLTLLALVARGEEDISPDVILRFDQSILKLDEDVEDLAKLLPNTEDQFHNYRRSILKLSETAGKLTGPFDAKPFLNSLNEWEVAKHQFDTEVRASRGSFRDGLFRIF